MVEHIEIWWQAFQNKSPEIAALFHEKSERDWDLPAWMDRFLDPIHTKLFWEYGPAIKKKGDRLVITVEHRRYLRPLLDAILSRAPKLRSWEFYPYRLAEDADQAVRSVRGRTGVDPSDFMVRVAKGEANRIDLKFTSPSFQSEEDDDAFNAAFTAAEYLLGGQCLDAWIGKITLLASPASSGADAKYYRLKDLKRLVDALIDSTIEQLPEAPCYEWINDAEWALWRLEPNDSQDFTERADSISLVSGVPEVAKAVLHSSDFCSLRFSRCGETFCYLKIDGSEGLPDGEFGDRGHIEEALNEVLIPQKLGCHIGSGTGLRHSYIDLALTNVDQAIAAIKQRLREGNVPKRSWIQFFDTDLAAEWVGIYEDTPPPPMDFEE
jgi:hypothetical protein